VVAAGFRHFDCAQRYLNERQVGEALREGLAAAGITREDILVTTKIWNSNPRPERVGPVFEASLNRLNLNHLDLYSSTLRLHFNAAMIRALGIKTPKSSTTTALPFSKLGGRWRAWWTMAGAGAIELSDITLDELLPI
jgi:aldehyde reductase